MSMIISDMDYHVLKKAALKNNNNRKFLKKLMETITVVRHAVLPKKIIKLNSLVSLWHSVLKKTLIFRLVSPDQMDLKNKKISVFAPIGMAIFGRKENDSIKISIDGIEKELIILKVENS